ncbi:DISARM system phospholipase D-like protein DrmC [Cryptosporangium sp. NPDC051539]|uniref:DISARM system phospholipase D-like protein DrmC n=1 Tax=Cryptosporangium sp. NPDC051539 TaxID=3363962 RepID=UPI003793CA95
MGSSDTSTSGAAARTLAELLTGTEAKQIADRLEDGNTLTAALRAIGPSRRLTFRPLLASVDPAARVAVMRAIEGARTAPAAIRPIWTMPGHVAQGGPLTSSVRHLVNGARNSVVCSTYNFQRSSSLWAALGQAARRPGVVMRVYVDGVAASSAGSPTAKEVASHLTPGVVLQAKKFGGSRIRNHAKFLAVDHRFLLVSSANFSWSAENDNVELGLMVDDRNLTESIEREMAISEEVLYERILAQ